MLAEVTGLDAVSLQPAAGSQGELTGLLLMRAYFAERGEDEQRRKVVIPDTAHGTNPASVTMAGYELTPVKTDPRGNIDVEDLRGKVDEHTAGLMLTNPSTLGLFDENIEEIAAIFHRAGALMYYDGANLNAVCGISRPGRHGLRHRPHQPAQDVLAAARRRRARRRADRGRASGSSRSCRCRRSCATATRFRLDYDRPQTIGKVRGFLGPFGVFVRSYAFIKAYGPQLREMSEVAVLNANYLLARLRDAYELPYDRLCMHEFVLSARKLKREHGVTALDVAKRLMDYGFHPPTVYFPLVVPEALMIEPTETEAKETLDEFADAMIAIAREAAEDPELAKSAPHGRAVGRLDEVKAVKRVVVRYLLRRAPGPVGRARGGRRGRGSQGRLMIDLRSDTKTQADAGDARRDRRGRGGGRAAPRGPDRQPPRGAWRPSCSASRRRSSCRRRRWRTRSRCACSASPATRWSRSRTRTSSSPSSAAPRSSRA